MKKKISLLLCTLALALGMTACGELKDSDEVAGRRVSSYRQEVTDYMASFGDDLAGDHSTASKQDYLNWLDAQIAAQFGEGNTFEMFLASYNMSVDDYMAQEYANVDAAVFDDALKLKYSIDLSDDEALTTVLYKDFKKYLKVAGEYKGIKDYSVEKAGKTITSTVIGDFSKKDLKMTFVYSTLDSSVPTAMNVEPVYTLGEIMKKAALNTVMGILIVFVMLVVMSAVIKGFEIIPKIEKKLKESKETAEDVRPVAAAVPVSSANNETDDLQLVAVIAAAIAASTGASTDSFVVRSIKKR